MALVAVLALGGCSEEPTPQISTSPTPAVASPALTPSSPSATNVATDDPEEFLDGWFSAGTIMQNSGVPAPFLALSRSCDPCQKLAATVTEVYAAGGTIRTDDASVESVEPLGTRGRQREFVVSVRTPATEIIRTAGAAPETLPGGLTQYRFTLLSTGDGLKVEDFVIRPVS